MLDCVALLLGNLSVVLAVDSGQSVVVGGSDGVGSENGGGGRGDCGVWWQRLAVKEVAVLLAVCHEPIGVESDAVLGEKVL